MRKLMWFSVGFASACGYWAYFAPENWLLPLVCVAAVGVLAGLRSREMRRIELACFGCVVGLCWFAAYRQQYLLPAVSVDGGEVTATVTITGYSYETNYGVAADGTLELDGKPYQVRVYINEEKALSPGDTVSGTFRLRYTPGGEEEATYHAGKGIFLLGYQRGEAEIKKAMESGVRFYAAELAKQIKDRLRQLFPEDVFPFTQALLLGDGSELSYEIDTAFKLSGIRHIIAVSGLHVTLLYSLLSAVTFKKRYLTALLTLPTLFLFAAVAGFTPSVVRACIMVGLMVLAQVFNKQYDPPTSLAFSALVMLIANPLVITSVSFQLTVGCVAGIQLFSEPIGSWMKSKMGKMKGRGLIPGLKRWFVSSVSITLSAMSLTTPLSAYYFGAVSIIGVVTNLLTLWVANFIFNGLIVACLISLVSMKAATSLAAMIAWPIRFVLAAAKFLGGLPLAAVYTVSPYIVAWLVFVYVLLIVFLFSYKRRPILLISCGALGLCLALCTSWLEPKLDDCRMTMLDVGQGQSILLQSGDSVYLVDCGGDSDTETADIIAENLLSQGITHLDGIILTHTDRDHAGALENLLTRIGTEAVYIPETAPEVPKAEPAVILVGEDRTLPIDGGEITIYGPIYVEDDNENSLCVLFDTENCDILITGDRSSLGEMVLVYDHTLPKVDVLVAGHHGSKDATSELLLRTVQPEIVLISAGAGNPFGHPAQAVLDRLADFGCRVFRTDLNGTVTFRR